MPLDPLGSLSDPTCHGLTLLDETCVKLTRREKALEVVFWAKMPEP